MSLWNEKEWNIKKVVMNFEWWNVYKMYEKYKLIMDSWNWNINKIRYWLKIWVDNKWDKNNNI